MMIHCLIAVGVLGILGCRQESAPETEIAPEENTDVVIKADVVVEESTAVDEAAYKAALIDLSSAHRDELDEFHTARQNLMIYEALLMTNNLERVAMRDEIVRLREALTGPEAAGDEAAQAEVENRIAELNQKLRESIEADARWMQLKAEMDAADAERAAAQKSVQEHVRERMKSRQKSSAE